MALLGKIFPARRAAHHQPDHVREKFFAFNTEQVRFLLFRECDFRGRKLLFDSKAVEKVPIEKTESCVNYAEVSNGFGYLYTKPNSDFSQLAEMVFGSVAMSFRGTYFKIHNLTSPTRLMFTQVFPSPPNRRQRMSVCSRQSVLSRASNRSLEQSIKLDDSGASSTNSTCEHLSDRSTASDTMLISRRLRSSPLDVPQQNGSNLASNQSLTVDSGCTDQSFSSVSTGSPSLPSWDAVIPNGQTLSCSLFKRLLRRSSRSLDRSGSSITGSGSVEEYSRPNHRQSKLGLAIIMEIPEEKQENIIRFFMDHIALLESMIWRARLTVESAYHRPATFVSAMVEVARASAQWLLDLLSGPRIAPNLWQNLSCRVCDNRTRASAGGDSGGADRQGLLGSLTAGFSLAGLEKAEFPFFSIGRLLRGEGGDGGLCRVTVQSNNSVLEGFVREFCEMLETVDVKDTNFFMSTLLTAVLTHHLGWVATCSPSTPTENDLLNNLKTPYNALWGQLCDIYGAIGHPVKTAQTIVTGTNKNDFIVKILNFLTYFIRYNNVERRVVERGDICQENKAAERICLQTSSIPKENFKTYEDHLKTIMSNEQIVGNFPEKSESSIPKNTIQKLGKSSTHVANLAELALMEEEEEMNDSKLGGNKGEEISYNLSLETHMINKEFQRNNSEEDNKILLVDAEQKGRIQTKEEPKNVIRTEKSIPTGNSSLFPEDSTSHNCLKKTHSSAKLSLFLDQEKDGSSSSFSGSFSKISSVINIVDKESDSTLHLSGSIKTLHVDDSNETTCDNSKSSVIFVLGDDEKLVGLKKESEECSTSRGIPKRPSTLALTKSSYSFDLSEEKEMDFKYDPLTTSLESLPDDLPTKKDEGCSKNKFVRSQSEPPEDRIKSDHSRTRYRYSGKKFNLQQYPEVVKNYMKSKNLEFSSLPLDDKSLKLGELSGVPTSVNIDFPDCESDSEEVEVLQTPSNASELEFTSDLFSDPSIKKECGKSVGSNVKKMEKIEEKEVEEKTLQNMKIVNVPMPKSVALTEADPPISYTASIMKGLVEDYVPDIALQGTAKPRADWESRVKSNLALAAQHAPLDQPVEEAVAIVANMDTWEVQVMSSHTYVTNKGSTGIPIGMSQLVANMLESLLQMYRLHIPPQYCIMHIEQRLQELCVRSKALAQLLLATEFCSMEVLTSTLHLEVNDVPLLMAVASTHTPQVTQKYGISFQ